MTSYSRILSRPKAKVTIITSFTALFVGLAYSASNLTQAFDAADLVPEDSYVRNFVASYRTYFDQTDIAPYVYFRHVDHSNPYIQDAMEKYLDDLMNLKQVSNISAPFWLRDFKSFATESNETVRSLNFNDQVDIFLKHPLYHRMYNNDIVRGGNGTVITSRTTILIEKFVMSDVQNKIAARKNINEVTAQQAVNQEKGSSWRLFTFHEEYYEWEMYSEAVTLLILTASIGILCSAFIALIFIPHWSGCLFVASMVAMLYVELLGFIQLCGVHLNTMVSLLMVMSIGLMVDYVIHPALGYYESNTRNRQSKTNDILTSIGLPVLLGGVSSILGVTPLAFASNDIFFTLFVIFVGLVTLSLTHGLVLLPVLLSIMGPEGHFGVKQNEEIFGANASENDDKSSRCNNKSDDEESPKKMNIAEEES